MEVIVRVCSAESACSQRVLDAIVHMRGQHVVRGFGIAFQGALKKSHVLRGSIVGLRQLFVFPLKGFIHNLIGSRLK